MTNFTAIFAIAVFSSVSIFGQQTGKALRPFSATIISTYGGAHPFQLHRRYAQAPDGSTAYFGEHDPPDNDEGLRGEYSSLLNMRKRVYIDTNALIKAAVVRPLADAEELSRIGVRYSCQGLTDETTWRRVGESEIKGFKVIEVIEEEIGPLSDDDVTTLWVAPDLNCFQLKRTRVKNGKVVEEDLVESLDLKEPSPTIFDVPHGYSIVRPAELERLYRVKFPGKQLFSDYLVMRLDADYQRAIDKAGARPLPIHKK